MPEENYASIVAMAQILSINSCRFFPNTDWEEQGAQNISNRLSFCKPNHAAFGLSLLPAQIASAKFEGNSLAVG